MQNAALRSATHIRHFTGLAKSRKTRLWASTALIIGLSVMAPGMALADGVWDGDASNDFNAIIAIFHQTYSDFWAL